jgi:hypothetical protein
MTKPRPKTGEPRVKHQPLKIDLLPQSARDAIQTLYDSGHTWLEIAEQSARPFSEKWKEDAGGFVDWETLDLKVLEQFPDMKLPKSTLQRWFDLRVRQARQFVLRESAQAREFAAAFAKCDLDGANAAVVNALRDQVFALMQSASAGNKLLFVKNLENLTLAMTRIQRVEIQERRVAVDERRVAQLELEAEQKRKQMEAETEKAAGKLRKGELTVEDINRLPPVASEAPAHA